MQGRTMRALNVLGPSALVGVAAAILWSQVAEPAHWQVVQGRVVMTEFASRGEFPVLLWFMAIGVTASLLIGLVGQLVLRADWLDLLFLALGSVVASMIAWQLGAVLGPPDPTTVAGLQDGDLVPESLTVTTPIGFLVWPVGALLGVLVGSFFDRDHLDDQDFATAATTAPVDEIRS